MTDQEASNKDKLRRLEALYRRGDLDLVLSEAKALIHEYPSGIAYNLIALVHKKKGDYQTARNIYERLLKSNPNNTMFLTNLGNLFYDLGKISNAEACLKKSLDIQPNQLNAAVSLGNLYAANSNLNSALEVFKGLKVASKNLSQKRISDINYRIAEIYRKKGNEHLDQAIQYYDLSDEPLSAANRLECIYKTKSKARYIKEKNKINEAGGCNPLIACIQTHASIRYEIIDDNLFCRNPFAYIQHYKLTSEDGFTIEMVQDLLEMKNNLESTPQDLLTRGEQTSGNIFLSNNSSVQKIKNIIEQRITLYRHEHRRVDDGFLKNWPTEALLHGWIIDLKSGGSLGSHMHKQGWLSGSLYLNLQKERNSSQGNIVFDLHGAEYPKENQKYPSKELQIDKGDMVLFPSSIFHHTIPLTSNENRITLAFDLKPLR